MVTEDHEAGKNRLTQCPLPLRNASINRVMDALGHFIDTDVSIFRLKRPLYGKGGATARTSSAFFFSFRGQTAQIALYTA